MDRITTVTKGKKPVSLHPYNAQSIGRRNEQQDYFSFSDMFNESEYALIGAAAVLADGMGGMANGSAASRAAVEAFMEAYRNEACSIPDICGRLYAAVQNANKAVGMIDGAGSTLCAAVIKDCCLYWVSVGDSRIYLYRNRTVRQLNKEHNFGAALDKMVKRGIITKNEADTDPRAAMLTSYLGIEELREVDSGGGFALLEGDSVLLCSDGLYRELSDNEIADIIANSGDSVCDDLVGAALDKGDINQDNITVALIDID